MPDGIVADLTPMEFFREQLAKAMEHQRVCTSAFTEHYLVNLLAVWVRGDQIPRPEPGFDDLPLALLYLRAIGATRLERARLLRTTGDMALFVSGFFADSLTDQPANLRYYRALGGQAYAALSAEHESRSPLGPAVFSELSARFREFSDVLSEISETTRLSAPASIVRLYERWRETGSPRAAALLSQAGIHPGTDPAEGLRH